MFIKNKNFLFSVLILEVSIAAVWMFIIYTLSTSAVSASNDIKFPIAELGNCQNEKECRAYCAESENSKACLVFVKKYHLASSEEIAEWERFIDVASGGGPGGCRSEKECINYCEDGLYIVECTDFVAKHNLVPTDKLVEMKKIAKAVKDGAKLPGNCRGKAECTTYCEDPVHIDECLAFAEKAELIPQDELAEAKKVAPFIKSGETPGGCKSKKDCESYCGYANHVDECITFAEKLGLMSAREAELIKKAGGKSPGDCALGSTNPEEAQTKCAAFCNIEENRQTCFKFAVEMGLMTAEEASQIGVYSDFQACYAITTPKIRECIDENLGQKILGKLLKGEMAFKFEELEEMMTKIRNARNCTNRYADKQLQTFTDDPDALACLDSELGNGFIDKIKSGQVACGDASVFQKKIAGCMEEKLDKKLDECFVLGCSEMKTCVQKFEGRREEPIGEEKIEIDPSWKNKISEKFNACVSEDIRACLTKDCSEMSVCFGKYGKKSAGEESKLDSSLEAELTAKVTACAKQEGGREERETPRFERQKAPEYKSQEFPGTPEESSYEIKTTPELCASFASAPGCSYIGSPDSQNYQLCKKCFPDK